jgi:hypothetical protein
MISPPPEARAGLPVDDFFLDDHAGYLATFSAKTGPILRRLRCCVSCGDAG